MDLRHEDMQLDIRAILVAIKQIREDPTWGEPARRVLATIASLCRRVLALEQALICPNKGAAYEHLLKQGISQIPSSRDGNVY